MSVTAITHGLLLTVDPDDRIVADATVIIRDGRIAEVGPADEVIVPPNAAVIDARERVVMPGFVNTHTHTLQVLLRGGISHSRVLYDWLTNVVLPGLKVFTADDIRLATRLYCAEAVRAGITTIVCNEEPDARDPEGLASVALEVFAATGLRVVYGYMFRDVAPEVVWAGVPEERERDLPVATLDETFGVIERLARRWSLSTGGRVRVWPSPATTAVVTAEGLRRSSALARDLTGGWALHLAETRTEQRLRDLSPVGYLDSIGCLDERLVAGHCVHLDQRDIELMAERGVAASTQPVSNCYLGSGVAPVPALLRAGVRVGLGTDDANCNDSVNPFVDMRVLALLHRGVTEDPRAIRPETVFRMATAGGAQAIGLGGEIGSIEVGKRADIAILRLGEPQLTPLHSPAAALVFQAYGSEVETVLVDGRVVMRARVPAFAPDLAGLCRAAQAASAAILDRSGLRVSLGL